MRVSVAVLSIAMGAACGDLVLADPADAKRGEETSAPAHRHRDTHHGHNHLYPDRGAIFRELPRGAVTVNYAGVSYRFADGIWFEPRGPAFSVTAPPIGLLVPSLPPFATAVQEHGQDYLYANEVYYRARPELGGYEVVNDPMETPVDTASAAPSATAIAASAAAPATSATGAGAAVAAPGAVALVQAVPAAGAAGGATAIPLPPAPDNTATPSTLVGGAAPGVAAVPPGAVAAVPAQDSAGAAGAPVAAIGTAPVAGIGAAPGSGAGAPAGVAAAPAAAVAASASLSPSASAAPQQTTRIIAYPRNGQAPDLQARDRYECYRFAAEQSGFDPMRSAAVSGASAEQQSSYDRAQSACLEGRGYTVR